MNVVRNFWQWLGVASLLLVSFGALGQSKSMTYALGQDGVYVYHFEPLLLGKGWNIYKKAQNEGQFVKLNETPITGATYPAELVGQLGADYFRFSELMQSKNEQDFFLSLQANRDNAIVLSLLSPQIAQATGRLFVDGTAKAGDRVTYKIEFVDDLGRPTGKVLEESFTLAPSAISQPTKIAVSNDGFTVRVGWEYPKRKGNEDLVMHFLVMLKTAKGVGFESMVNNFILRDDEKTTYSTTFTAPKLNEKVELYVVAVDATEKNGPRSEVITFFVKDNIPPARVTEIRATMRGGEGLVTWDLVPDLDVKGYQLERSLKINAGYTPVSKELLSAAETYFIDASVQEGTNYFYRIAAVDESGNTGAYSAAVPLQVLNVTPPEKPTQLKAVLQKDKSVQLQWTYENPPKDLNGFLVMRRPKNAVSNFKLLTNNDFNGLAWKDAGPDAGFVEGQFYSYAICAVDSALNISDTLYTELQIPNTTPPQAPSFVNVNLLHPEALQLNWNASTSGDVVGYRIYRKAENGSFLLLNTDALITSIRYKDESLTLGEKYVYGIAAIDSTGLESEKQLADPILIQTFKAPRSVRNVQLIPESDYLLIRWEPVPGDHIVGYIVEQASIPTGIFETITKDTVSQTEWRNTSPKKGWWYRVRSLDTFGNQSRASEPVQF